MAVVVVVSRNPNRQSNRARFFWSDEFALFGTRVSAASTKVARQARGRGRVDGIIIIIMSMHHSHAVHRSSLHSVSQVCSVAGSSRPRPPATDVITNTSFAGDVRSIPTIHRCCLDLAVRENVYKRAEREREEVARVVYKRYSQVCNKSRLCFNTHTHPHTMASKLLNTARFASTAAAASPLSSGKHKVVVIGAGESVFFCVLKQ